MNYRELLPDNATRGDLAESFEIPAAPMPHVGASVPQAVANTFYLAPGQFRVNAKTLAWPGRFIQVGSRLEGLHAGVQTYREQGWLQVYFVPTDTANLTPLVRVVNEAELSRFPENSFPIATLLANPLIHELRDARPLVADPREVIADPGSRASLVASFDIPQARYKSGIVRPAPGSFYGSVTSVVVFPGSIQRDGVTISTPHTLSQNGASVYPSDSNLVFGIDLEGPQARAEGRYHITSYEYSGYVVWNAGEDTPAYAFPLYRIRTDATGRIVELEDVRHAQVGMGEM